MASTDGWMITFELLERSGILALLSTPSRMKLFMSDRTPLATKPPPFLGPIPCGSRSAGAGRLGHTQRHLRQIQIVAPIQRQIAHRSCRNHLSHGSGAVLEHRGSAGYNDSLGYRANLKREADPRHLVYCQCDRSRYWPESFQRRCDLIVTRWQQRLGVV